MRPGRVLLAAVLLATTLVPAAHAADDAADLARRSLVECEAGRAVTSRTERKAHFDRGQELAEQAVAADDGCADAHFALFCNLGELMRLDGESIRSALALRRLMRELDRTLELDPQNVDARSSKGQLLCRLPRLFGGDTVKGEAILKRVIDDDPMAFSARITLATVFADRGDRASAIAYAQRALEIARQQGRADKIARAEETLAELHAGVASR